MTSQFTSSNEFATLASKLQQSPEDPHLKQMLVKHLPQMRQLAKTSPLALYHLAQIYPPNSSQYRQNILQSADLGCTNAMLAACKFLVASTNSKDLGKAVRYMQAIECSQDSYIRKHGQELVKKFPQLAPTKTAHNAHGFFTKKQERTQQEQAMELGKSKTVLP